MTLEDNVRRHRLAILLVYPSIVKRRVKIDPHPPRLILQALVNP